LWDRETPADSHPLETGPLLTTAPTALLRAIHDRMPVTLRPYAYRLCLDLAMRDVERVHALLSPYPADTMIAYPVSTRMNNPA
jgi:putative SOS response-associated peptidase YedK